MASLMGNGEAAYLLCEHKSGEEGFEYLIYAMELGNYNAIKKYIIDFKYLPYVKYYISYKPIACWADIYLKHEMDFDVIKQLSYTDKLEERCAWVQVYNNLGDHVFPEHMRKRLYNDCESKLSLEQTKQVSAMVKEINEKYKQSFNAFIVAEQQKRKVDLAEKKRYQAQLDKGYQAEQDKYESFDKKYPNAVSAYSIYQTFTNNEVNGHQKYKGKTVLVRGTIESIDLDFYGNPMVSLYTGKKNILLSYSVVFLFSKDDANAVAKLDVGQKVYLQGLYDKFSLGFLYFTKSKIIEYEK